MELTEKEQAMIELFRELEVPPYNVLLWYSAGLKQSVEEIKHINPDSAAVDKTKIERVREVMRNM